MIHETRYLFYGLIAVTAALFAWVRTEWSIPARLALAAVAVVFGTVFLFWVLELFARLYAQLRAAYFAPQTRILEAVARLSPEQVRIILMGYIHVDVIPSNVGLIYRYLAPGSSDGLSPEQVRKWADICTTYDHWPELPAQHGMADNTERNELRLFTAIVCGLGLADPAVGPKPARWVVKRERVHERLEV